MKWKYSIFYIYENILPINLQIFSIKFYYSADFIYTVLFFSIY
ncbi:hypothetical protein GGQ94_003390 [Petrimonas sulfuriphila]